MPKIQDFKQIIKHNVFQLKNKKKTYVLIVLVTSIWATIGYKLISGYGSNSTAPPPQEHDHTFPTNPSTTSERFTISPINRDPFLGRLDRGEKKSKQRITNKKSSAYRPTIIYEGLIKNTSDQVFILTINGIQHLVKRGQSVDSLKLLKGNTNKVIVRYNGTLKTIKRYNALVKN